MKSFTLLSTAAFFASATYACTGRYMISEGDTFAKIAGTGFVSPEVLLLCNKGVDTQNLQIGQVIKYPLCDVSKPYKIQKGDTLQSVAEKSKVEVGGILDCNGKLPRPDFLVPGEVIQIPMDRKPEIDGSFIVHYGLPPHWLGDNGETERKKKEGKQ